MSKGTLEIDGNLPVQNYQKVGDNVYEVTFLPKSIGTIDFSIKYNDELLKGEWERGRGGERERDRCRVRERGERERDREREEHIVILIQKQHPIFII